MDDHLVLDTETAWEKQTVLNLSLTEVAVQQWKQIVQQHSLKDDSTAAAFLLRCYHSQGSGSQVWYCQTCASPLSRYCSFCFTLTPKQQQTTNIETAVSPIDSVEENRNKPGQNRTSLKSAEDGKAAFAIHFKAETHPVEQTSFSQNDTSVNNISTATSQYDNSISLNSIGTATGQYDSSISLNNIGTATGQFDSSISLNIGTATGEYDCSTDDNSDGNENSSQISSSGVEVGAKFEEDFVSEQQGGVEDSSFTENRMIHTKKGSLPDFGVVRAQSSNLKENEVVAVKDGSLAVGNVCGDGELLETFECDLCMQALPDPDLLVIHMQEHREQMAHECGECKARFFQLHVLKLHAKFHGYQKSKKYACDQCHISMSRLDNLNRHKALKHGKPNKGTFPDPEEEEMLKGIAKFTCEHCTKGFARRDNYNRHLLTHTGERQFGCQQCGAAFAYLNKLVTHMRVHGSQKPFQCGKCCKCFADSASLTKHVCGSPDKPKQFECGVCAKIFASSSQLILHSSFHVGKRKGLQAVLHAPEGKFSDNGSKHMDGLAAPNVVQTRSRSEGRVIFLNPSSSKLKLEKKSRVCEESRHLCEPQRKKNLGDSGGKNTSDLESGRKSRDSESSTCKSESVKRPRDSESRNTRSESGRMERETGSQGRSPPNTEDHQSTGDANMQSPSQAEPITDLPVVSVHPHCCQFCGVRFLFQSHLMRHLQTHTGENAFRCSQCPVSCRSLALLLNHERGHRAAARDFPCHFCGKVLRSPYSLKLHLSLHTGDRPFTCEVCGEQFSTKARYSDHKDMHAGERKHLCPYCGKSFVRSSNLSGHIRTHTNSKKTYPCQYCGRVLHSRNTHREHMRSHTGEKPYRCEQCGECFMRSGTYKIHIRKHGASARPHLCSVCGRAFLQPCHLRIHLRVHTGEKPYKCGQCPKAFALLTGLKEHMRKHTGDRPFLCSVCGKGFAKSCNRLAHYRSNHGKKSEGGEGRNSHNPSQSVSMPAV